MHNFSSHRPLLTSVVHIERAFYTNLRQYQTGSTDTFMKHSCPLVRLFHSLFPGVKLRLFKSSSSRSKIIVADETAVPSAFILRAGDLLSTDLRSIT